MNIGVYERSWYKDSFWSKFTLLLDSHKNVAHLTSSDDTMERSDGYSSLSSTYYSIAGTAFSYIRYFYKPVWLLPVFPLRVVLWGLLGAFCYWRMLPLSDKALACAGGYRNFSADKCDVRQSVLRKRGRFEDAAICCLNGQGKPDVSPHTRALLDLGLADAHIHLGNNNEYAERNVKRAVELVEEVKQYDKKQAIRIYKKAAELGEKIKLSVPAPETLRRQAKELAKEVGAKDQLLKMGAN